MRRLAFLVAILVASLAGPPRAVGQEAVTGGAPAMRWDADGLTLRGSDGGFTIRPVLRIDADAASFFGQPEPGGFRSSTTLRRGRLGAEGTFARDFAFGVVWDFGGGDPRDQGGPFEAQMAYTGLGWGTIRFGAFKLNHLPEFAVDSFDLLFLERATITTLAGDVASGISRAAIGLEARGERWVASAYATSGTISSPHDSGQRGAAGRAAALVLSGGPVRAQIGMNGAAQFSPGTSPGPDSASFADYPEVRVDSRQFLDAGDIPARRSWAWGPEAIGRVGPVYLEAAYQRIGVATAEGGTRHFSGWYAQGAVPLLGPPRERDAETGTWKRPEVAEPFNPLAGQWGALELAARYSDADLRDGPTRGGRQRIWTAGLNHHPRRDLRFAVDYENGRVALDGRDRNFQAVLLRASLNL